MERGWWVTVQRVTKSWPQLSGHTGLCWVEVARVHLCLVPDLTEWASSSCSIQGVLLAGGFSCVAIIVLKYIPFLPNLFEFSSWKDVEFRQIMLFLCVLRWSYDFYPSFSMCYWFVCVEPYLHSQGKSHLIMMYNLFNVLLNSVC